MGYNITLKHYKNKLQQKAKQHNHVRELEPYLHEFLPDINTVNILDVGSGPFVTIGHVYNSKQIRVIACDILAHEYSKLLTDNNLSPIIPIEYQNMEHLTYDSNKFDIVHCANALDHTEKPLKAIEELVRVCKVGGVVIVRCFTCVGERNNYKGLHYWNFDIKRNKLVMWNRRASFVLNDFWSWKTSKIDNKLIQAVLIKENKNDS